MDLSYKAIHLAFSMEVDFLHQYIIVYIGQLIREMKVTRGTPPAGKACEGACTVYMYNYDEIQTWQLDVIFCNHQN